MAKKGSKPTVRTNRRRDTKRDPGDRRRAEAPKRRREPRRPPPLSGSGGSTRPPSGGSSWPPSGGSSQPRPTGFGGSGGLGGLKLSPVMIIIIVILFVCIGGPIALLGGGGLFSPGSSGSSDPVQNPPPAQSGETVGGFSTSQDGSAPVINPPSGDGQTWLVMLYQDADDKILEQDIFLDLNEAELVGSSDRVHIVAQLDRYRAGYSGDGNWSGARRYYVTQDNDLNRISSQLVGEEEVNMADGEILVDFVTWAVQNYPADKHVLIMSDHGLGWPGGWSDTDSKTGGTGGTSVPLANALGDQIYLMELDDALASIRTETGIDSFELVGMDACLMGHIEVFSALAPHANYAVASQEVEPAIGWAYTDFLRDLVNNPDMDGAGLGQAIVDSYITGDRRIVDDQARAELLRQTGGGGLSGLFGLFGGGGGGSSISPTQLAQQMSKNSTISAVNLNTLSTLNNSLNALALAMQDDNQRTVAQVRTYTQSYTNIFGKDVPPSYIDLGHFAQLLKQQSGNSAVNAAADDVLSAINQTVVAEKHGPDNPAASGVSIYFPNSQMFAVPAAGPESYTAIAQRFSELSLWDDFLTFHYTGRQFDANAAPFIPDSSAVRGPGSEQIQLTPIEASSSIAAPNQPVLLSTEVTGQNVGYAYFFAGFIDSAANSIFVADSDYLESSTTLEVSGVFYPVWPDTDSFTLEFEWEPLVFAITDGEQSVVAHFTPRTYGETSADAVYTVDGIYTYADGGETRSARLYFQDGVLTSVYGFSNEDGTGAPREIVPNQGDTFTILEEWMDLDASGNQVATVTQTGGTLTFSNQTFTWEELIAAEGDYVVGFIIEDLDGNQFQVFTEIEVQ